MRIPTLKTAADKNIGPCIFGVIEGETRIINTLNTPGQLFFYKDAENEIKTHFRNHLAPTFRLKKGFALPSTINWNSHLADDNLYQTFILIIKPNQTSVFLTILDKLLHFGINITGIKTQLLAKMPFKGILKIAGIIYEEQLTYFMETPVLMLAVNTTE